MSRLAIFVSLLCGLCVLGATRQSKRTDIFRVTDNECTRLACDVRPVDKVVISRTLNSIFDPARRRGCCSWHSGVCGCTSGRAVCCDGTLSPGCGCD